MANIPAENNIPVIQIETKMAMITDTIELYIMDRLKESFGVTVSGVDLGAIEIDKTSDGYRQLMSVTKEATSARVQAETKDYVERLRIKREEGQYALHKQTQSFNIGAFQVEKQAEVGIAGAEALGQMGANSAGRVNLGGDGGGFNPVAVMTGMALGGAVGQNMAGIMNGMMGSVNQPFQQANIAPPSIPGIAYHVAVNGQATGPFDLNILSQMVSEGKFLVSSLVWKAGMPSWVRADSVEELKVLFTDKMPPIPTNG